MKHLLVACTLCTAAAVVTGCSSDEDFYYKDQPRVRLVGDKIWAAGSDSVTFSFVAYGATVTEQLINVDAQIMGNVADRDRTVTLAVVPELTTAAASQYVVPEQVTIPAGQAKSTFAVALKRDASLLSKTVRLYVRVTDSSDFLTGVNEDNHIVFIWNDILSKPNNWESLESFFGTYSDTKYRFMLENAGGIGEFNADTMSWAQLNSLRIKFQNQLNDYNAAHPGNPLTDEFGQQVSF